MNSQQRQNRRFLVGGSAVAALGVLCALWLGSPSDEVRSAPVHQSPAAASSAPQARSARAPSDALEATEDTEKAEETAEAPVSRRDKYTAAFDRKIHRIKQRIAEDCGDHEILLDALDDFDAVRDRIVDSAVATDRGLKTKDEQREYERAQLQEFDSKVCHLVEGLSLSRECQHHFHGCEHTL